MTVGIHRQVPDLARETMRTDDRSSSGDDPTADADLTGDEHHLLGTHAGAESGLGEGTQVGIVAHRDRKIVREDGRQCVAQRDVDPADVGRDDHEAVELADESRHGDAATDQATRGVATGAIVDVVEQRREIVHRRLDAETITGARHAHAADDRTVERHDRCADLVDEDLDRECANRSFIDPHDRRRTPWPTIGLRRLLDHQVEQLQLADQAGDRAARQTGCPHEL